MEKSPVYSSAVFCDAAALSGAFGDQQERRDLVQRQEMPASLLPTRALERSRFPSLHSARLGLRLLSTKRRHSSSAAMPLAFMPLVLRSLSLEIPCKPQNQKTFLLVDWLSDGFEKGKPVFFPFRYFLFIHYAWLGRSSP